jgi:uncharacterized delta-60 repeat protein
MVIMLASLVLPAAALGAAGDPDPSFSGDGMLTTDFGTTAFHSGDSGNAAARLSTGEIYIAGESNADFALVRLTSAGVLDTTFGGGDGIVTTDISGSESQDAATALSVDGSGRIVVAGTSDQGGSNQDFAVARYTSAGILDTTFGGGDGIVTTDIAGGEDSALAVIQLPSGNIVVAGGADISGTGAETDDFALVSYTSAGVLDPAFDGDVGNGNGKVTTDFGSDDDAAAAALVTAGPKILVAGRTDPTGADAGDFALARYNTDGTLDSGFDADGKQTISFSSTAGNGDSANALTTDATGRILVAGFAGPGNGDFAVARLDGATGAPDGTFDTDGKQTISTPASGATLNSQDICNAVTVQADGKILLGGTELSSIGRFMVVRLSDTGVLEPGFGTGGFAITDFGGTGSFNGAVAVFVDETAGKILAAGSGDDNFAAARYAKADGALDTTYGLGGKAEADVPFSGPSSETAMGVALQPDGKLVVVGPTDVGPITQVGGDQQFGLARYNTDGSLDVGFGAGGIDGDGRVNTNFRTLPNGAGTEDAPSAVALQSDGKIVVVGRDAPNVDASEDFAVARYNPDGSLDSSFGAGGPDGDGKVTTDFGGAEGDSAEAVAIEGTPGSPSFRIVVAGMTRQSNLTQKFALAAYDVNGNLDSGFGGGKVTTDFGGLIGDAHAVAIQPDGRVVAAGDLAGTSTRDFALARFATNGAPDPSFGGGDGEVTTDFVPGGADGSDLATSVAVSDLGGGQVRIVAAGRADGADDSDLDGAIAAYTTDGSLDPSFAPGGADGNGKATFELFNSNIFDSLYGVAIQPDGKIVAAGSVEAPGFGVIRVTSTGSLDPTFGGDGLVSTSVGPPSGQYAARGLALLPDGRIAAAGGVFFAFGGSDFFVARYGDPPPSSSPPGQQPSTTPATPKKKKCKKKKHRAAAAKKCKKKK